MRHLILLLPVLLVAECAMGSCSDCVRVGKGPEIKGSGTPKTETRTVETFTAIRLTEIAGRLEIERTGRQQPLRQAAGLQDHRRRPAGAQYRGRGQHRGEQARRRRPGDIDRGCGRRHHCGPRR